jgi:hypothetical protein
MILEMSFPRQQAHGTRRFAAVPCVRKTPEEGRAENDESIAILKRALTGDLCVSNIVTPVSIGHAVRRSHSSPLMTRVDLRAAPESLRAWLHVCKSPPPLTMW